MDYIKENEMIWDTLAKQGNEWSVPISVEEFALAKNGKLKLYLTPSKLVPQDWFPVLKGAKVLGLASGGGQQGPVFAAHGSETTIMDLSDEQLESERLVARREGYSINIVKADMTESFPFGDETFDLIFHPVSNCYVKDIQPIWDECYRVLKRGGTLLSVFVKGRALYV